MHCSDPVGYTRFDLADFGVDALGAKAAKVIDKEAAAGRLAVSAISFWEAGMLAAKGRIKLPLDLRRWRRSLLETGLQELPLNGDVGIRATQLQDFHADPANRMICATAPAARSGPDDSGYRYSAMERVLGKDRRTRLMGVDSDPFLTAAVEDCGSRVDAGLYA